MTQANLKAHYSFNRAELDHLIASLNMVIKVANSTKTPMPWPMNGICRNWRHMSEYLIDRDGVVGMRRSLPVYSLVAELAMSWEHTLSPNHPSCSPIPDNLAIPNPWREPNKGMRLSLMRHITKTLRAWRRRTPA